MIHPGEKTERCTHDRLQNKIYSYKLYIILRSVCDASECVDRTQVTQWGTLAHILLGYMEDCSSEGLWFMEFQILYVFVKFNNNNNNINPG
jgi:hypothetical protein